jgi:hypothetical protein
MGGATETVKYAEVLRKGADGKWRYVVDMFSPLRRRPRSRSEDSLCSLDCCW